MKEYDSTHILDSYYYFKYYDCKEPEKMSPWQPMETAPRDGTKIDLLYPYPRNRMIDAFWDHNMMWVTREPKWRVDEETNELILLPEKEWDWVTYSGMEPLCWMPCPEMPEGISFKYFEEDNSL